MGDCGRVSQVESCATSVAQDMSDARDIARRFEQLETQWMNFQKKSAKLEEVGKDNLLKSPMGSPRNRSNNNAVSSVASSYSNPLFTNHTIAKPAEAVTDRPSTASSRISSPYAGSATKPERAYFSSFCQRKSAFLATSSRDVTATKDDNSPSLVNPPASIFSSPRPSSEKISKDGQGSPSSESVFRRATVPSFSREKPPLSPAARPVSKAPMLGNEKHVTRAALSIARQSLRKNSEYRRDLRSSLKPPEILGILECSQQSASEPRPSSKVDSRKCGAEIIESIHSISYPSSSDPATYSSGKGPPQSNVSSSVHSEQSNDAHDDQSRSPPGVPHTSVTEEDLKLGPLLGNEELPDSSISWRALGERGILTEGSLGMEGHPTEPNLESEKSLSSDVPVQDIREALSKNGNELKLEVQIDKKDIFEAEHVELGDRLDKVNWELQLSKREAALRIAEEKMLEEQQNISQAQLAVSRCEDSLRQREHDAQHELEKQKNDLADSLKSIETGKTIMKKLCAGLKDVLWHLEQKEKVLQNTWLELKDSVDTESVFGDHSFCFEPEASRKDRRSATFDGISFLIAEEDCEQWCSTVVGICERLVGRLSRETHLQKWGIVLEREGMRMAKMIKDMAKTKEAVSERCARSEEMMKCAEAQASCMSEERVKLARERENLILWVTHLQERRKAVAECEREAAASLTEVQKKAADLFVHESNIDGRALEISALQEELRVTSQRLQDDQERINREKHKVQEKLRQAAGRERDVDSKISVMKKLQSDLNAKAKQLEENRVVDEERKEKLSLTLQETEERINAKETCLRELEKELDHKGAAAEEMTKNLNEREKQLTGLQRQMEQERSKIRDMMATLEKEKLRLQEAEEAVAEAYDSKKSAEEAWARTAQERRESTEYLKSVEDRLKQWEDRLRCKEKELQGQQKKLQEIENHAREEQEHSEALHAKLVQEQESWTQELKAKQESLSKRSRILDAKEEEINNDLERLTEERRVALEDIKRLAEMETRAWSAERELQTKHDEHLREVRKQASEYHSQVQDLELAKLEVKKEFEEVRAKKQELKIWQLEAEETLQSRIDSFIKGKEELTGQIKELKKLQMDIEQAGSQILDRVAELDQASTRLERQRHKVETSKSRLEGLADKLAAHQEVLKRRESDFLTQEAKLVAVQNGLKKMAVEAATKEKNLRTREQAVVDGENCLHDMKVRLLNERIDLEKMIAEVEQHAAKLKEEAVSVEEISHSHTRDGLVIEERREKLQCKERELADFETDLKKKAKSLEEHGQAISKLEIQVKERLQRAVDFETKSEELEKGWERLLFEREALNRAKAEIQKSAETHEVQWQLDSEKDEIKRKRTEIMEELRAREAEIDAREAKAMERETALLRKEQQTNAHKHQVEKDAEELRQQLQGARAELEDQRRYVEEKRNAAEAIATDIEEREARLKLKEHDLAEGKVTDSEIAKHGEESHENLHTRQSSEVGGSAEREHHAQMLGMQLSGTEEVDDLAQSVSKLDKRKARVGYQHVSKEFRTQRVLVHNQMESGMEHRLKQMENAFHKEAAKISKERANLILQQQDLEETKQAVEDVKLTLTAQLKATKQMVMDASLTAQNASSEREALEEERKRLAQNQKDAEASVAAKEEKLALEAKQLESMKSMLEQETAKAMELIQQAAKRAMAAEHAKAESSISKWDATMLHKDSQCEASLKDREELNCTADAIRREKRIMKEERAKVQMLHDALEREHIERSLASLKNNATTDALIKDAENRRAWEEMKQRRDRKLVIGESHVWDPTFDGFPNDRNHITEEEFSFSATKGALEANGASADLGEGSSRNLQAYRQLTNHKIVNCKWEEAFGSATSSTSATLNQTSPDKMAVYSNYRQILERNDVPSRQRFESVMTSLMHARQASRSRLQRTENALLAFPPSSGFITQVQQALNALSARLSLMEQIEEGLESHLRNAYETEAPESEGLLVDKVQLMCRMEEQQSLRAEWEEDMQRQLETISMLQSASRSPPNFSTPPRVSTQGAVPMNDRQDHSDSMYENGNRDLAYEMKSRVSGTAWENPDVDQLNGGSSRLSDNLSSLHWNTKFESYQGADSKELSYSPLVDFECLNGVPNQHLADLGTLESGSHERSTRRKLLLSPPQMEYA